MSEARSADASPRNSNTLWKETVKEMDKDERARYINIRSRENIVDTML